MIYFRFYLFLYAICVSSVHCENFNDIAIRTWLNETYFSKKKSNVAKSKIDDLFYVALRKETGIMGYQDVIGASYTKIPLIREGNIDSDGKKITLLQHALAYRKYYRGEITGIFDKQTAYSVKKLKNDALGIQVADSSITPVWFEAILNQNSYTCSKKGSILIRRIQQYLNRKYFRYCGIIPCNGEYSRRLKTAIAAALQYELKCEKIDLIVGVETANLWPRFSIGMKGNLVYLLQCALCINGFWTDLNGKYDKNLFSIVKNFQKFFKLPETGVVDSSVLLSLFSSAGDKTRSAIACDCSTILSFEKAYTLYKNGYRYVGRYLTGNIIGFRNKLIPKYLTRREFAEITRAGLRVFPIYQDKSNRIEHFSEKSARKDATTALDKAYSIGIPGGTTIYFSVDFDPTEEQTRKIIVQYFKILFDVFSKSKKKYFIGVYGTRRTCSIVSEAGYAKYCFISDIPDVFIGNAWPMPKNWSFDQFCELKGKEKFKCKTGAFELDKVAFSNLDIGCAYSGK